MKPYYVSDVLLDEDLNPMALLAPCRPGKHSPRVVPIWMGTHEAALIAIAIGGDTSPSPLTHDLIGSLLGALGSAVERVELACGDGVLFEAVLAVGSARGRIALRCRPSDAIALAVRGGVPIHLDDDVIARHGIRLDTQTHRTHEQDMDDPVDAFHRFIAKVEPGDF